MSKQVSIDEVAARQPRGREVGWERWADGNGHLLARGEDFPGRVDSSRSAFLQWAKRQGFKDPQTGQGPPTRVVDDGFWLQVPREWLSDQQVACATELQRLHAEGAPLESVFHVRRNFRLGLGPYDGPESKARRERKAPYDPAAERVARLDAEREAGEVPSRMVYARRGRRL